MHPQDQLVDLAALLGVPAPVPHGDRARNVGRIVLPLAAGIDEQDLRLKVFRMVLPYGCAGGVGVLVIRGTAASRLGAGEGVIP